MKKKTLTTILTAITLLILTGCTTTPNADNPNTRHVKTAELSDGRFVDCVTGTGFDCDWKHPYKPGQGKKADFQVGYYKLHSRTVPCVAEGSKFDNGVTCDFD